MQENFFSQSLSQSAQIKSLILLFYKTAPPFSPMKDFWNTNTRFRIKFFNDSNYCSLEHSSSENLSPSISTVHTTKQLLLYQLKSKYFDFISALYFYVTWIRKALSHIPDFTCWGSSLAIKFLKFLKYSIVSWIIWFSCLIFQPKWISFSCGHFPVQTLLNLTNCP